MALININAEGVGKYAPVVYVIEIDCGAPGFSSTSRVAINPKEALLLLAEAEMQFPRDKWRIAPYVRLEEIDNASL